MEVVALVASRDHVCTRYRIAQFRDHLADVGLPLRVEPLASHPFERFRQVSRPRPDQVVVLVRKLLPRWQLFLLRRSTRFLAYDFDDAVYLRNSFHHRGPESCKRRRRFAATIALADCVFAGNEHLASQAAQISSSGKIRVQPTCLNPNEYRSAEHHEEPPLRLVWIGSKSTLKSLEKGRDFFEAVGRDLSVAVLRVICDRFPDMRSLPVEPHPWSIETEKGALGEADVGVSWMPDDDWSRGKCGLKVLQYMAAGLPVVASPVGVHSTILEGGIGLMPRTIDEWIRAVRSLNADTSLRRELGRAGRQRVIERYHVDRWGSRFASELAGLAGRA